MFWICLQRFEKFCDIRLVLVKANNFAHSSQLEDYLQENTSNILVPISIEEILRNFSSYIDLILNAEILGKLMQFLIVIITDNFGSSCSI
jgi:hypothetical protein